MTAALRPSFIVKICGITNEEDARAAVEAGANALGFNFYPKSPRYIAPCRARQIAAAVSGAFLRVGIFVSPGEEEVKEAAAEVPLDVLQLYGPCEAAFQTYRVWRVTGPGYAPAEPTPEAFFLDTPCESFGGSGKTFDWRLAAGSQIRTIIAGGLDSSNVANAIRTARPWGVDACSRLESKPGKKDPQRVREFVQAALAASECLSQEVTS
jgi:phosphoribosylanthranilate isomerase